METAIELLMHVYLKKSPSGLGYLKRLWIIIDHAFESLEIEVVMYVNVMLYNTNIYQF